MARYNDYGYGGNFGFPREKKEPAIYEKVPRPAYRTQVKKSAGEGFLLEGLDLKVHYLDGGSFQAYFNPKAGQSGAYSGIGLLTLSSGKKLEVSVNGLGKNSTRQKVIRAITFDNYQKEMQKRPYIPDQKRSAHKARARSRSHSQRWR